MILVGLGANLPSPSHGGPLETCAAALDSLAAEGEVRVAVRSRWYRSRPVPASDQPWFVNAVARVETVLGPEALLARLHAIERRFGRMRGARNAARSLDLDLLAFHDRIRRGGPPPELPHPRMHQRAFVLVPLVEIAPDWRHPVLGCKASDLLADLPPGQDVVAASAPPGRSGSR